MDSTPPDSGLYVPYCIEENGQSRPLATALWLDAGKHLCQQHLMQRCRSIKQRLQPEQWDEVPAAMLEKVRLEWQLTPSGIYEAQPQGCGAPPLAMLKSATYRLHPAG